MTIQELGSIGELIAAIATVITLLYLAAQIRHNAQLARSGQSQEFVRWNTEFVEPLVTERHLTELWIEGGERFEELDPADQLRITLFEWRGISAWNHYYHMRQKGLIDDHHWKELTFLFERIGERQAMKAAWRDWRDAYDEDFRSFMDGYLG